MDRRNWTLVFIGGCIGLLGGLTAMIIDGIQGDPFNVAVGGISAGAILATVALSQRKKTPTS